MGGYYGSIVRLSGGRYRVYWGRGRDPQTGRRLRQSKVVRGTRADAEAFLARQAGSGFRVRPSTKWGEYWETSVRVTFGGLAVRTVQGYERVWAVELAPRIASDEVRSSDWRWAESVLSQIPSPSVQRHAFALLRKMCRLAVRDGLLASCPVDSRIRLVEWRRAEHPLVWDVRAYMAMVRGSAIEAVLLLMLGGGLRVEEAAAIEWPDVAEAGGYVVATVDKARVTALGGSVDKGPKNGSSERMVVIGEPFASRIAELRADGRVCPVEPSTLPKKARREQGDGYVRPKDLRASYASLCAEAGCPDSLVSNQMGHAGRTTKDRHYQRGSLKGARLVADMLEEHILRSTDDGGIEDMLGL